MRYFLYISYLGTRYSGWQRLPGIPSVQGEIETWLSRMYNQPIEIKGSGRTDTGVHAAGQVAHVDLPDTPLTRDLAHKLNRVLPGDISIDKVVEVALDAHARFSAIGRTYRYRIHFKKNPFLEPISWQHWGALDLEVMNQAAWHLIGEKSFRGLSKTVETEPHYLSRVTQAQWQATEYGLEFTITANRFLRGMVRATVGALCRVGQGMYSLNWLEDVIDNEHTVLNAALAPPHGLTLENVEYLAEIFETGLGR